MNIVSGRNWSILAALLLTLGCTENGAVENGNGGNGGGGGNCERGENRSAAAAISLAFGEAQQGYLCPVGDSRWYSFSVSAGEPLVGLTVGMSTALTPVEITYQVYEAAGGGAGDLVASARLEDVGRPQALQAMECFAPGDYLIQVKDFRDNNQDVNHPYEVLLDSFADPDTNSPNDDVTSAVPLTAGQAAQGYIACRGDQDHYSLEVGEREVVQLDLTMGASSVRPFVEVRDSSGTLVARMESASGGEAVELSRRFSPSAGAGTYGVVVGDVSGFNSDLEEPYELTALLIADLDPNEPNNSPADATDLSGTPVSCGGGWSSYSTAWGTISAPGDLDWFRLPIQGCGNGIIEAEMVFDTSSMNNMEKWELAEELQAELVLMRSDGGSSCTEGNDCAQLSVTCSRSLDCAGYGENCDTASGTCVGGRACLQDGTCGGAQVSRRYECPEFLADCSPSSDRRPAPNRAVISAPLFGGDAVYLRAGDFQSQASFPQLRYDLRVRVRQNPDANEPNNLFTNQLDSNFPIAANQAFATEVPVRDCTAGDCCGGGNWVRGRIVYQNDMDWFYYDHPCPDEDCTLMFHYQIDSGPVDLRMDIFRERTAWQTLVFNAQAATQSARSGTVGGLSAGATCYYASQLHAGEGFRYYMNVRDQFETYANGVTVVESSRDWDPDQEYRFCIEKVSNVCEEPPCQLYTNGCGAP